MPCTVLRTGRDGGECAIFDLWEVNTNPANIPVLIREYQAYLDYQVEHCWTTEDLTFGEWLAETHQIQAVQIKYLEIDVFTGEWV